MTHKVTDITSYKKNRLTDLPSEVQKAYSSLKGKRYTLIRPNNKLLQVSNEKGEFIGLIAAWIPPIFDNYVQYNFILSNDFLAPVAPLLLERYILSCHKRYKNLQVITLEDAENKLLLNLGYKSVGPGYDPTKYYYHKTLKRNWELI